jgi:hypothetical protein
MSLRSRARSLQKKTGLSYQQALAKLRALGERPALLAKQTGWTLEVCDRYCVDGHAPIGVVEVYGADRRDQLIVHICERLRAAANARSVVVILTGRGSVSILAHVGEDDLEGVPQLAFTRAQLRRARIPVPKEVAQKWSQLPEYWELQDEIALSVTRFKQGSVVVKFHRQETTLGLVRLRARRAADELEDVLGDEPTAGVPPLGGAGGVGGLPAQVRVVEETRDPPPEPKRVPISRKKKRSR